MTALYTSRPSSKSQQVYLFYPHGYSVQSRYFYRLRLCRAIFQGQRLAWQTCYVLLYDRFSNTLYGALLHSKAPPIERLTQWLATKGAGPTVDSKYVQMDLRGEVGRCQEVLDLFTQAGYAVEPTTPNSSVPNETLEIRSVPHALECLLGISFLAVCVLSFSPTPQHDHSW
jgi:hypothetical protein